MTEAKHIVVEHARLGAFTCRPRIDGGLHIGQSCRLGRARSVIHSGI
jgi:hypothetical protein